MSKHLVILCVALAASCGGDGKSATAPSPATFPPSAPSTSRPIEILSLDIKGPAEIWIGEINYLTAWGELSYPMYAQVGGDFESMNPAIVAVTSQGRITGIAAGAATVRATIKQNSGDLVATHSLTVLPLVVPPPTRLTISPGPEFFWRIGERVQLQASADNPQRPSSARVPATWTSSNSAVAVVSPDGLLTVRAAGTTQVRASFTELATELPVTVLKPLSLSIFTTTQTWSIGRTDHFLATGTFPGRPFREDVTAFAVWRSSNPAVLAIDAQSIPIWPSGKALTAGTSVISATYAGVTATMPITVLAAAQ